MHQCLKELICGNCYHLDNSRHQVIFCPRWCWPCLVMNSQHAKEVYREEKEILVNPNCPVRVMVDYIRSVMNESNLNQATNPDYEIDLCDENGNLKNVQEIPPWTNGIEANLFTPRLTYIVVVFERDEEGGLVKPMPLVARSSRQYSELISKIRRQLNPSIKKINKNESKQTKGSKSTIGKKSGDRVLPK